MTVNSNRQDLLSACTAIYAERYERLFALRPRLARGRWRRCLCPDGARLAADEIFNSQAPLDRRGPVTARWVEPVLPQAVPVGATHEPAGFGLQTTGDLQGRARRAAGHGGRDHPRRAASSARIGHAACVRPFGPRREDRRSVPLRRRRSSRLMDRGRAGPPHLGDDAVAPDLAGWRRQRMPGNAIANGKLHHLA
jgi:hypothetical protein